MSEPIKEGKEKILNLQGMAIITTEEALRKIKDLLDEQICKANKAREKEMNRQLWGGGYKVNA